MKSALKTMFTANSMLKEFYREQEFAFKMALKLWEEAVAKPEPVFVKASFGNTKGYAYTATMRTAPENSEITPKLFLPVALFAQTSDQLNDKNTGKFDNTQ